MTSRTRLLAAAAVSAMALCTYTVRAEEPAQTTTSQEIQASQRVSINSRSNKRNQSAKGMRPN